jgi:subtilase family serine protease
MKSITRFRSLSSRKKKIYTCTWGVALAMGVALPALAVAAGLADASAQPAGVEQVGSLTAPKDLGRVVSDKEQTITVHLKLHDQAGFDQAVSALYDPASPTFHHWFTDADFAKYAPTAAELQTVRAELERQGLKTVSVDPLNFSIRVRGGTTAIESAFHTELHTLSYGKSVVQTPISEPKLAGSAGDLVAATAGVERHRAHPLIATAKDPLTGKPQLPKPLPKTETAGGFFAKYLTGTALTAPTNYLLPSPGGGLPTANYYGIAYALNYQKLVSYTPSQLQTHYRLTSLINQGYDGRGQTIALVEAYGYAAAEDDANAIASIFGLPPLNSNTFQVIYPSGQPGSPNDADLVGWTPEIALDIQSAHALAPGAKIVEVAAPGQDDEDFLATLQYILTHHVATIVSNSWEVDPEFVSGPAEEQAFAPVLQRMAAAGISVQFSSGDSGDFGLGTPVGAVSVPSNSPYVTAVGGTSILNDVVAGNSGLTGTDVVTGWGNAATFVHYVGGPEDPPLFANFTGGSGGGESLYYSKPSWQSNLPGTGRQVPDVSADADPDTGVPLVVTEFGQQLVGAEIGGTSLASPLFSAIWAIAQQYNHETLGQAAPTVARLKPGQITDVVDTSDLTPDSLSGTITDSNGTHSITPADFFVDANPAIAQSNYLVTISPLATTGVNIETTFAYSFGTDMSLTVGPGWDNVTGFGEPNGLPFIQAVGSKNR